MIFKTKLVPSEPAATKKVNCWVGIFRRRRRVVLLAGRNPGRVNQPETVSFLAGIFKCW